MAKKQWTTVNINDFFAPEQGPTAPIRLTTTSTPPPPPISGASGSISSSGEKEKIVPSRRRFDDDVNYVSKRRGKNRGGRNKGGMKRPTPHINNVTRARNKLLPIANTRNKPLPIVNIGQILYNRKVELNILENLKQKGQPLEFMSEGYSSASARQIHIKAGRIVPMSPIESYISRVDRLVENNMQEGYLSEKYGTDNILKDGPSVIREKKVRINNLTDKTNLSTAVINKTSKTDKSYIPSSVNRYLQTASINSSQPAANITSAFEETLPTGTPGRMMSSTAKRLADDTMRAASVIHSSKLGFAAIGAGALGAAFGISSLRSKSMEKQMEMERV